MNSIINILGRDVIYISREKELLQDLIFLLLANLFERGDFLFIYFFKIWQEILQNERGDHKLDALYKVLLLWHPNPLVSTVCATFGRLSRKEHFAHQMSNFSDGSVKYGFGKKGTTPFWGIFIFFLCIFISFQSQDSFRTFFL